MISRSLQYILWCFLVPDVVPSLELIPHNIHFYLFLTFFGILWTVLYFSFASPSCFAWAFIFLCSSAVLIASSESQGVCFFLLFFGTCFSADCRSVSLTSSQSSSGLSSCSNSTENLFLISILKASDALVRSYQMGCVGFFNFFNLSRKFAHTSSWSVPQSAPG